MENSKAVLIWITSILKKNQIPFQITGGLAAIAYGATRPLADIDIDIPDDKFDLITQEVKEFITYGPAHFKSEKWDLFLMTLNYKGQEIDLSGSDYTYIFNEATKNWEKLIEDLTTTTIKEIFGLQLPVIPYISLLTYKKMLAREVDLIDVEEIEKLNNFMVEK